MATSTFKDRTVLLTGASRGIGRALGLRLASEGANVALVARDRDRLEEVVSAGDRARLQAFPGDVSDAEDCARIVAEVQERLGPVDVLIACAGILRRDFIEDVTVTDLRESLDTNVGGAVWLTQRVLPEMRARGWGRVVLVSSELGLIGGPSYASYCASKWALVGLAEVLHHELSNEPRVRVCAVCPGDVNTDQLQAEHEWGPTGGVPPEKAMSPDYAAAQILRAAATCKRPVVVIDRPHLRLFFDLMAGPRRLRMAIVASAFKGLSSEHESRSAR